MTGTLGHRTPMEIDVKRIEVLNAICSLLETCGEKNWKQWFTKALKNLKTKDPSGIDQCKLAFQGKGSVDAREAVYSGTHQMTEAEISKAISELENLFNELYFLLR